MNLQQTKQLGNTVGFVIAGNKPAVLKLLRAHGVAVSNNSSDSEIIGLVIDKIFNDQAFNKSFDKLSKSTAKSFLQITSAKSFSNASGFPALDLGSFSAPTTTSTASTGSSFDLGGLVSGILGAGTSIFGQISTTNAQKKLAEQQAKTAKLNAESAIAQANAQIEIEKIRLAQIQSQQSKGGGNTLMYVGIGLAGIIVVGGLIFAFKK